MQRLVDSLPDGVSFSSRPFPNFFLRPTRPSSGQHIQHTKTTMTDDLFVCKPESRSLVVSGQRHVLHVFFRSSSRTPPQQFQFSQEFSCIGGYGVLTKPSWYERRRRRRKEGTMRLPVDVSSFQLRPPQFVEFLLVLIRLSNLAKLSAHLKNFERKLELEFEN